MRPYHQVSIGLLLLAASLLILYDGVRQREARNARDVRGLSWEDSPMMVACGSPSNSSCSGTEISDRSETHAVRCCRDTAAPGWAQNEYVDSCSSTWAASYVGENMDGCYWAETYGDAETICAESGGRLCTVAELTDECTINTGCGHDGRLVWTSTSPYQSQLHARYLADEYSFISDGLEVADAGHISSFDKGDYMTFDNVWFGPPGSTTTIRIRYSKACCTGGIQIRLGGRWGAHLLDGSFIPTRTGDWHEFNEVDLTLSSDVDGMQQITFVGVRAYGIMNFAWFELKP